MLKMIFLIIEVLVQLYQNSNVPSHPGQRGIFITVMAHLRALDRILQRILFQELIQSPQMGSSQEMPTEATKFFPVAPSCGIARRREASPVQDLYQKWIGTLKIKSYPAGDVQFFSWPFYGQAGHEWQWSKQTIGTCPFQTRKMRRKQVIRKHA